MSELERYRAQAFRTEAAFRNKAVMPLAEQLGYRCYFTFNSEHSVGGFPDLLLLRVKWPMRLIVAELKIAREGTKKGTPSPKQIEWLEAFNIFGTPLVSLAESDWWPRVEAHVWRPSDWFDGTIEKVLRGERIITALRREA